MLSEKDRNTRSGVNQGGWPRISATTAAVLDTPSGRREKFKNLTGLGDGFRGNYYTARGNHMEPFMVAEFLLRFNLDATVWHSEPDRVRAAAHASGWGVRAKEDPGTRVGKHTMLVPDQPAWLEAGRDAQQCFERGLVDRSKFTRNITWTSTSIDALVIPEPTKEFPDVFLVECKCVSKPGKYNWDLHQINRAPWNKSEGLGSHTQLPTKVLRQVDWEMGVTGCHRCVVIMDTAGDNATGLYGYDVRFDQDRFDSLLFEAKSFYENHLIPNVMP